MNPYLLFQMLRYAENHHLREAIPSHMKQLCHSVSVILKTVKERPSVQECQSCKSSSENSGTTLHSLLHSCVPQSSYIADKTKDKAKTSLAQTLHSSNALPGSCNEASFEGERHRGWSLTQSEPGGIASRSAQQMSPSNSLDSKLANLHCKDNTELGGLLGQGSVDPDQESSASGTQMSALHAVLQRVEGRLTQQQQQLDHVTRQLGVSQQHNVELQEQVRRLEAQLADREARICNGSYFWRIEEFSKMREKALAGEPAMLHSPSFYTSPWGYRLCLRANINLNTPGGPHLSLFVHMMQGDFDSFLPWPFSARIGLMVMDQNISQAARMPIAETLETKPQMAAFQRPATARNHKGYGYTDFVTLSVLDQGSYLLKDVLIIHVTVTPGTSDA